MLSVVVNAVVVAFNVVKEKETCERFLATNEINDPNKAHTFAHTSPTVCCVFWFTRTRIRVYAIKITGCKITILLLITKCLYYSGGI